MADKPKDRKAENMIDMALVNRFRSGDKEAFFGLVTRYKQPICSIVRKYFRNEQDADDISQEVFISLFKSLRSFRGGSMFFTWFYRLTINTCLHHKRGANDKEVSLPVGEKGYLDIPDYTGNPLGFLEKKDISEKIEKALGSLPADLKAVIVLREMEGLSYEEIAGVQSVSLGTVKSRIHNARILLGEELKKLL